MVGKEISRRKALVTTGGVSSVFFGTGQVVASQDGDDDNEQRLDTEDVSARKIEKQLAGQSILPQDIARTYERDRLKSAETLDSFDLRKSTFPQETQLYVGAYTNAESPADGPVVVEDIESFEERRVPAAYDSAQITPKSTPNFYFTESLGSWTIPVADVTLDFGFGAGFNINSTGTGASVGVSIDFFVGSATITFFETSVGAGYNNDELCLTDFTIDYSTAPEMTIAPCISLSVNNSSSGWAFEVGGSFEACADPCPWVSCTYCQSLGGSIDVSGLTP